MDFNFSDEQKQFADALRRWAQNEYSFEARQKIVMSDTGVSDAAWSTLVELGMTALPVPEEHGGFNGTAVDLFVVMQEMGRALVVEPYFATVLGAQFLKLGGRHPDALARVGLGELKLACALGERQARYDMRDLLTTAHGGKDGYVLNGSKAVVAHGPQAGAFIVSARTGGSQRDIDGISLFYVPADAPGVSVTGYRTIDGQRAANVEFKDVFVPAADLIGTEDKGCEVLDAALDYGVALLCAEGVGAMEAIFEATLEYLKTRSQFGVPIGKFQALQHRMADMYIHLEQARSMALLAAVKADSTDGTERRRAVSAAKYRVGQAMKFVGQQAVQLHGGMGVTNELPAAHHFKRLAMIELTLGDSDHHLQRFIAQGEPVELA